MKNRLTVDREGLALLDRHHLTSYPDITDTEAEQMLHALGSDGEPYRKRLDSRTYHAYRNYYDAGGDDVAIWDGLVSKGLAVKGRAYHVTVKGIRVLEILTQCRIYDARLNVADCRDAVLERMVAHDVSCGYGRRLPVSAVAIADGLAIPVELARKTLNRLADEGLVTKDHFGGMDGDGCVHCIHGWSCTPKARELELYSVCGKAERARLDTLDHEPIEDEAARTDSPLGRATAQKPAETAKEEGGLPWA